MLKNPDYRSSKIIAISYAAAVAPSSVDDMETYTRNVEIFKRLITAKWNNIPHMMKLLKVTHSIRSDKIKDSSLSMVDLQKEYPFFKCDQLVS